MDLVSAGLTALVSELVKEGVHGLQWVFSQMASRRHAAQGQGRVNAQHFGDAHLAPRLDSMERLPPEQRALVEDALNHPGTHLLVEQALISASATENDDRHEILSELIAQRLTAKEDDMVALAGAAACNVVNALASRHIRLLGLIVRLLCIRPTNPPEMHGDKDYERYFTLWWAPLGKLTQGLEDATPIDVAHLLGLSCLAPSPEVSDLCRVLISLPVGSGGALIPSPTDQSWWPALERVWGIGLGGVQPTSTGRLIGTFYHDSVLKTRSWIPWDRSVIVQGEVSLQEPALCPPVDPTFVA